LTQGDPYQKLIREWRISRDMVNDEAQLEELDEAFRTIIAEETQSINRLELMNKQLV
jgi:hypothetical protein